MLDLLGIDLSALLSALGMALAALAGGALWGRERGKRRQAERERDALKTANEVQDDIATRHPDRVRDDLARWMRD
ncbi:hypothetical protein [Rhodovulum sp. ES.010]|uniref:hypothetical protein n=1 Tax=Rhodovulum sp. ES.010 TaxID=1882821 RepID=UPI0009F86338|nr:hypothetical protein [Rhodovulum sp. ES.010]